MTGWWLTSYVLLWLLVSASFVVQLIVLRQLGLIYLRAQNGGFQLDEGPAIGLPLSFREIDVNGETVRFPMSQRALNLLVFTTPWCGTCEKVLTGVNAILRHHEVGVVIIDAGDADESRDLRGQIEDDVVFVASLARQRALGVTSIPYAILTDREGVIIAKGLVNHLDDLEDMLEKAGGDAARADIALSTT